LSFRDFKKVITKCGFALGGQTKHFAPADKKLYALRDATATVPYIPLIVASIMSKKLAEGLDALVLDVKTGSGAFIKERSESIKLARALVATGRSFGVKTRALITDMSEPLGKFVGNAHEVYECVKVLRGEGDDAMMPTLDLSAELTANLLVQCKLERTVERGRRRVKEVLASGEALERFRRNVELQHGDASICDDPEKLLNKDLKQVAVKSGSSGYVAAIDTFAVGRAVCDIGGGRIMAEDGVDHAVGYAHLKKIGRRVKRGEALGVVYCRRDSQGAAVAENLRNAYKISEESPRTTKLIRDVV
jgi:pyrimidine-nucleoside phosphorylase